MDSKIVIRKYLRYLVAVITFSSAHLTHASLLPTPQGASQNTNFPGWDIRNFSAGNPVQCADSCKADRRCLAWTWSRPRAQTPSGICWLKSGAPTAASDRCCISGVKPPTGKMEVRVDRPGEDYRNFKLESPNPRLCENACYEDRQCKSWTYVKPNTTQGADPHCWLKKRVARPVTDSCCISGAKPDV